MKRILLFSEELTLRGSSLYTVTLARELKLRGHKVAVLGPGGLFDNSLEKHRIPITSFLTSSQVTGSKVRYFERISRWGSIQNHTTTHASLATSDAGLIKRQVCPVQVEYRRTFGAKPWMLRPPYGAGPSGSTLHDIARRCKITDIVMWDAVVDQGRLTTRYGGGLQPGSVILLHYTGNLAVDLKVAVTAARAQGLKPANLDNYLRSPRSR